MCTNTISKKSCTVWNSLSGNIQTVLLKGILNIFKQYFCFNMWFFIYISLVSLRPLVMNDNYFHLAVKCRHQFSQNLGLSVRHPGKSGKCYSFHRLLAFSLKDGSWLADYFLKNTYSTVIIQDSLNLLCKCKWVNKTVKIWNPKTAPSHVLLWGNLPM